MRATSRRGGKEGGKGGRREEGRRPRTSSVSTSTADMDLTMYRPLPATHMNAPLAPSEKSWPRVSLQRKGMQVWHGAYCCQRRTSRLSAMSQSSSRVRPDITTANGEKRQSTDATATTAKRNDKENSTVHHEVANTTISTIQQQRNRLGCFNQPQHQAQRRTESRAEQH